MTKLTQPYGPAFNEAFRACQNGFLRGAREDVGYGADIGSIGFVEGAEILH